MTPPPHPPSCARGWLVAAVRRATPGGPSWRALAPRSPSLHSARALDASPRGCRGRSGRARFRYCIPRSASCIRALPTSSASANGGSVCAGCRFGSGWALGRGSYPDMPLATQSNQCYFKFMLLGRPAQLALQFSTWGGARDGAGRPPKGKSAGVSHLRRPALSRHHPLHVTLRLAAGVPSLRSQALFVGVRGALARGQERFGFRLVHFSVQSNHLHLIAEAADRRALSRGVQGLSVRVARAVNGRLERKGRLFADRYHARALKTPRAVGYALRYVLLNARRHHRAPACGFIDSRSSAAWFPGFCRPGELVFGVTEARAEWRAASDLEAPVAKPKTWLLRVGYRRRGAFDLDEVPGPSA